MRSSGPNTRWRRIATRHARARRWIKGAFLLACTALIVFATLAIAGGPNRTTFLWLSIGAFLAVAATGAAWKGARDFEREFGDRFRP
jgi:hypothetical protein